MTQITALSFGERKETQMEKFNGIIIDGKIYEAVKCKAHEHSGCRNCCFYVQHGCYAPKLLCRVFEGGTTNKYIFRYSPELTDKLNKK